jgi:hypothetical protein
MEQSEAEVNRLKAEQEQEPGKPALSHAEWKLLREKNPILQLSAIRDDLDWLLAGEPDPEISMDFFVYCSNATDAAGVGRYLQEFWKKHPFTFLNSGWVATFVGRVVLEDENATRQFLRVYRKKTRATSSRERGYRALKFLEAEHRKHWIRAVVWMRSFRARKDGSFVDRAVEAYCREYKNQKPCGCLIQQNLETLAKTVLGHSDRPPSAIVDYALATLFQIGHGTLCHLRAEINKKYGPGS